jgi:transglutaminase-like putative cysteine protease
MKKLYIPLFLLLVAFCSHAQLNIYSALTIPDSLKKDADMVMREENLKVTIKDKNTAWLDVHQVFTVLNEQAKKYLFFQEYSDKFRVLDEAEIKVYDLLGNKINTWSKKEMTSGKYGNELVPEGKITYFNVNAPSYPITVEFNYRIKYKGIFTLPGYNIQSPWQSVQHSVFEVEVPADLGVRYKLVNTNQQPQIKQDGGKDVYTWEIKNVKAYKLEKHSGSSYGYEPTVLLGPTKFQLDEYDGDMTTWKNFGAWIDNLYAKTTALPEEKKAFYRDMVKNAATDRQKAEILYNYMQNNMRYVSIQLGIGGLRPFPASFVDDKKYGDCKALSNYLKSALDAVGVKSNLLIIQGGMMPREVYEDFSANYFNHAILCIPQPKDTIWLECTSTTLPFAQLGPFTENRKAMMVTENGGALVNTPVSNYKTNTQHVNTFIEVNDEGGAKVKTNYTLWGEDRDELLNRYHDLNEDEKRKYFITQNEWKQPDDLQISNSNDKANPYLVSATMDYEKIYSFNAGSKLFFEARLYPIFDVEIPEYEKRKADYYFTSPYQVIDTTVYKFPAVYTLENIPKNKQVQFSFAQYSCNYSWDAATHTLTSVAVLQIKDRVIKAADYTKLLDFKKQVMADVNEKVVMKR